MNNLRKDRFTAKEGEMIIIYPEKKKKSKAADKPAKVKSEHLLRKDKR